MAITPPTILIVDDEPTIRRLLAVVLRGAGYHILEARDAVHALEICKDYPEPIHLLITDVVMPSMNGKELATLAVAHRQEMRVLYISGYAGEVLGEGFGRVKEVAFLPKPFGQTVLLTAVKELVDN